MLTTEQNQILSIVDHTMLDPAATEADIRTLCDDALAFGTASVCIPPSYVRFAKDYLGARLAVCTVIGFPNGYATTKAKVAETACAIEDGADEIDMVINIGWLKDRRYTDLVEEIRAVKAACQGRILKVIIETCRLLDEEKIEMCRIVAEAGADYIKTSTGFSSGGATPADIAICAAHRGPLLIKAAGGISSFDDAREFIRLGADRLGTSRLVRIAKQEKKENRDESLSNPAY